MEIERSYGMKKLFFLLIICGVAAAGMKIGGRIGYYNGEDPRTQQSASNAVFGGQIVMPLMGLVDLEISGSYSGSESDISMQQYLVSYIEEEYGQNFSGDSLGLTQYLENEWGWSPDSIEQELISNYTATFHDIDLGATMKVKIPIGAIPLRPYIGGGAGAHIIFSDADILIQVVNQQTGGNVSIDPYDHVHPGIHGVIGAAFEPPAVPISFFAEYKYTKPIGGDTDVDGISMVYGGINLGF
jgi:hypothetical protein